MSTTITASNRQNALLRRVLSSWYKGYRAGGTGGDAEAASEASGLIIPELVVFELAGSEDASVNAPTTPCTLFRVLLGYKLGREDLGGYAVAEKSAQGVAAAGTAAADYRRAVVALHCVSHVDEAGLVAPSQSIERLLQRGLVGIVSCELGQIVLGGFYAYADISWSVAVPLVGAAAAVLKNDLRGLS